MKFEKYLQNTKILDREELQKRSKEEVIDLCLQFQESYNFTVKCYMQFNEFYQEKYQKCLKQRKEIEEIRKQIRKIIMEVKLKEERLTNIIEHYFKLYDTYKRDTGNYPDIELTFEGE